MKIGIFGGSFNPPHQMHKQIALNLINQHYVDKVIYVPTGNYYQKKDLIDIEYRLDMLKLMCANNPQLDVSDFERQNTLVYTYQTLDYFKKLYPDDEIYFICGSDNLINFVTWKNYQYILNNYQLLVIMREGSILNLPKDANIIITNISSQNLSSTQLRDHMDKTKLDDNVYEYIQKNKLYKMKVVKNND